MQRFLNHYFRCGSPVALLVLVLVVFGETSHAECTGNLVLAKWRAEILTRSVEGICCWTFDEAGALRMEISAPADGPSELPEARTLLRQAGSGWTLILGEPGQGTWNAWGSEWSQPPSGVASWIRTILSCDPIPGDRDAKSYSYDTAHALPRFFGSTRRENPSFVLRWLAETLVLDENPPSDVRGSDRSFRGRMTHRGHGRGDDAEIATLAGYDPSRADGDCSRRPIGQRLVLNSSRRPGQLSLEVLDCQHIGQLPAEVFLPLWPLSDFLTDSEIFPGTRRP